ncbi:protein SCARECROW 1 isoform X2 [Triticum aestivum]|uniref:protein SCARECROW 1 isoform X2 n=1 Tax=Triticum aestivum TaxID=4565 RepID=UPI001D025944|nr:protein SCARECROW 1-like isoform X2 [Triticum aestivum]
MPKEVRTRPPPPAPLMIPDLPATAPGNPNPPTAGDHPPVAALDPKAPPPRPEVSPPRQSRAPPPWKPRSEITASYRDADAGLLLQRHRRALLPQRRHRTDHARCRLQDRILVTTRVDPGQGRPQRHRAPLSSLQSVATIRPRTSTSRVPHRPWMMSSRIPLL